MTSRGYGRYRLGDVVLLNFDFTDRTTTKRRPAVVISSATYHDGRGEAIIAAITSNTERVLVGDHRISGWREAGLRRPSVATAIITTVRQPMIERRIGSLTVDDLNGVRRGLQVCLGFSV